MGTGRATTPSRSAPAGAERDVVLLVDGLSKRYPVSRVTLFPPVANFHRGLFKRRRSSEDDDEKSPPEQEQARAAAAASTATDPAPQRDYDLYDDDDLDDEEDDDDLAEGGAGRATPMDPGEMFWALKDISFTLRRGKGIGVLGGPDSGKSALLRVLAGQAFPTEGRVLARDPVSIPPEILAKGISLSGPGTFDFDLVIGSRLLGIEPHFIKPHRNEIEALAAPLRNEAGDPAPGALLRLGIATAAILPWNLILIEEPPGVDPAFMAGIVACLRRRLRAGSGLVFASRNPDNMAELCDEVIVLSEGSIASRRAAKDAAGAHEAQPSGAKRTTAGRSAAGAKSDGLAPPRDPANGRPLRVPEVVPGFNQSAALLSATLSSAKGSSKRIAADSELAVEIRVETAVPGVEAQCGVAFTPRSGDGTGIRLQHPEPLRFAEPGTYVVVARTPPGALRGGAYEVSADAIVAHPKEREASVISRVIGRVRIVSEELEDPEPVAPPLPHWDGSRAHVVEAEWSLAE